MSNSFRSGGANFANRHRQVRPRQNQRRTNTGQYIDPSRFIKPAIKADAEVYVPTNKFSDFALNPVLQTNLTNVGYETPSPIQDQAIPAALAGQDVIGIASTGTGKTAAFVLPILNRLMSDQSAAALIIAPTRELAQQIEADCRLLGKNSRLFGAVLIGGTGMGKQLRELRQSPRLVIGTPGRIKDHQMRGTLKIHRFNMVVLDEVDRMLDMGFVHDVTFILSQTNSQRQSFFFSATLNPQVRTLIDGFTKDPITFSLKASATSENVHQDVVRYNGNADKIDKLHDILLKQEVVKAIVFDSTQRSVERLNKSLTERGFSSEAIHGGKSQGQRQRAMGRFKNNEVPILVATDVAARGIDVADITHVINFSVPKEYDDYIHRIGRAGRAGQFGYALTFVAN